ncbi:MAG: SulP family inorganic anion transporter [Desulfobacterales bacterium]|jgi:anti-anti-sigma factor|nr:SulP family inorganic anion transporter [Desulfobacterales bacterium]
MLEKIFPFLGWFKNYNSGSFKTDLIAGLTVALVLIPQSMAYAQLAGLPAYYGLYAAFLPPMLASLFGSSRQLATGPVAVVSLMTAASLAPLAKAGSPGYITYAVLLALMVGAFQFSLGLLRLGLVVNFLSHPVVNGFTNAAAIIIASSQLSKMFGVSVDEATHHYETILRVIQAAIHYTHWPTFAMGVFAFAVMYALRWFNPKIPNVLVAVVATTLISFLAGFEHNISATIYNIPDASICRRISEFNKKALEIEALSKQRTDLYTDLSKVKEEQNIIAELNAEHDLEVISYKIDTLNEESHNIREDLRKIMFAAIPQPDGSLTFYIHGNIPPGEKTDGRIWRIKVGNNPIPEDKITLIGGGAVVGVIPKGLPAFSVPKIDFKIFGQLFPYAVIISLLGFMEAISIAKAMAAKTGQRLDPNQELIGQGLANMIGAIGKSYPTSGSFSRSAVNLQAGAVSGLSSVFTSLTVVIALLFFTPLLYHLPQSVLAAVIMMAVIGLINVSGFIHAWEAQWYDGAISIITFICTLAFAPHLDKGIMVGVVLSLSVFIYKRMRPSVVSLSRAEDQALRCARVHQLKECKYIAMIRFDGPLFFANASYLEDKIMEIMQEKKELKHIVIVSNGINDIDASGEETLSLLVDRVRSAGVDISLSGVNEAVMSVFKRTHFPEKIGEHHIFPTMEKAIESIYEDAHRDKEEGLCPLVPVCVTA